MPNLEFALSQWKFVGRKIPPVGPLPTRTLFAVKSETPVPPRDTASVPSVIFVASRAVKAEPLPMNVVAVMAFAAKFPLSSLATTVFTTLRLSACTASVTAPLPS
jgi:hypothetical protein